MDIEEQLAQLQPLLDSPRHPERAGTIHRPQEDYAVCRFTNKKQYTSWNRAAADALAIARYDVQDYRYKIGPYHCHRCGFIHVGSQNLRSKRVDFTKKKQALRERDFMTYNQEFLS